MKSREEDLKLLIILKKKLIIKLVYMDRIIREGGRDRRFKMSIW